jgi:hypothetical protein
MLLLRFHDAYRTDGVAPMAMLASVVFIIVAILSLFLALLMIIRVGYGRLESALGIARDGPKRNHPAPTWQATDNTGKGQCVPSEGRWQLLIFADHNLASFPELIAATNRLPAGIDDLDVMVLARSRAGLSAETIAALGISAPIVMVDQQLYDQYKVRVMPYVVLVNENGIVKWTGIGSNEGQLRRVLHQAGSTDVREGGPLAVQGSLR